MPVTVVMYGLTAAGTLSRWVLATTVRPLCRYRSMATPKAFCTAALSPRTAR
jgi:hypothetical protein